MFPDARMSPDQNGAALALNVPALRRHQDEERVVLGALEAAFTVFGIANREGAFGPLKLLAAATALGSEIVCTKKLGRAH